MDKKKKYVGQEEKKRCREEGELSLRDWKKKKGRKPVYMRTFMNLDNS